jgi:hypothetical protein
VELPFGTRCNCVRCDHNRRVPPPENYFTTACCMFARIESHFWFFTLAAMCVD